MNRTSASSGNRNPAADKEHGSGRKAASRRISVLRFLPIIAAVTLAACASTAPSGRSQFAAPQPISSFYSSLDLNLTLASLAPVANSCAGIQCQVDKGFERQVLRLGARLAETAYAKYPSLRERIPQFDFVVAEKMPGGSSSDASGTIAIYRGVRKTSLEEETLAYLIAHEMGHVIARHHDEKSAASIISSLVAQIVFAPANLTRAIAFIASSTAGAFGKNWVTAGNLPEQQNEADIIALELLASQGWGDAEIVASLQGYSHRLGGNSWSEDVRSAASRLAERKPAEALASL